jgi:FPC/CPF motif-containing protein YcgG
MQYFLRVIDLPAITAFNSAEKAIQARLEKYNQEPVSGIGL